MNAVETFMVGHMASWLDAVGVTVVVAVVARALVQAFEFLTITRGAGGSMAQRTAAARARPARESFVRIWKCLKSSDYQSYVKARTDALYRGLVVVFIMMTTFGFLVVIGPLKGWASGTQVSHLFMFLWVCAYVIFCVTLAMLVYKSMSDLPRYLILGRDQRLAQLIRIDRGAFRRYAGRKLYRRWQMFLVFALMPFYDFEFGE